MLVEANFLILITLFGTFYTPMIKSYYCKDDDSEELPSMENRTYAAKN